MRRKPLTPRPVPTTEQGTTKGPWLAALRSSTGHRYTTVGIFIWRSEGEGVGYRRVCRNIETEEDAHLIKACPDLYAACAELIRGGGTSESLQRAIDLARYALDRADNLIPDVEP